MKSALWLLLLLTPVVLRAEDRFSQRLTEAERRAAGLDTLSAEQLAALDALVKKDRGDKAASSPAAVPSEATLRAELEAKLRKELKEEARVELKEEEKSKRDAERRILSRIAGRYEGWSGRTVFRLENGQVWRQLGSEMNAVPPTDNPPILIEKVFGGWRLYDSQGGWVPVVRVR